MQTTSLPNSVLIPHVAQLIASGKTVTLQLRGWSMRPYLEDGRDKGLLTQPPATLRRGDVILAQLPDQRYALHRIICIQGDNITMQGDGNLTPEYITRADVIAIAIGFYRKGRTHLERTDSLRYRLYWHLWLFLRPLRRWLLLLWRLYHYPGPTVQHIWQRITKS